MGVINDVLKPSLVQKHTRMRFYETSAWSLLYNGREAWTAKKQNIDRVTDCETKFMARAEGYTKWDNKINEDILDILKLKPNERWYSELSEKMGGTCEQN
jgi:hypothetical protein